jgi:hypothetical protein
MALAGTTQLEAINTILSIIGEAPINSLTGTLPLDGTLAVNILAEISREVQSAGWFFNTEHKVTLSKDTDSKIPLGANVMRVDVDHHRYSRASIDPIKRGLFLYNKVKHSFTFDDDLEASVVYYLEFTELPENVKRYITIRAGRVFADRVIGARDLHGYTALDERNALAIIKQEETDTADYNVFDHPDTGNIVNRLNVVS